MPHAVSALKAVLQLERSHVGDMSFSVGFDQTKHRVRQGRRRWRDGDGRRNARRHRGGGKGGASTDGACDRGRGEETAPRWIAWREHYGVGDCRRVYGWRAKHAVSLGHLGSQSAT
jgi:hypothetical protein